MKGIILAGGSGTRLYPITTSVSKQLLPVYDKPMIYYALSVLMLSNIKEILIISTPTDLPMYKKLLKDGSQLGIDIQYKEQNKPNGIAEAFIIGESFIGNDSVALILGDNIFYGKNLEEKLYNAVDILDGATVFAYQVENPTQFGVVTFDKNYNAISIEEKPLNPESNYAIPGLYFYNNDVVKIAKDIKPSNRGELEITSVNNEYIKNNSLKVEILDEDVSWFDSGTCDSLLQACNYIKSTQDNLGICIGCIEAIAYKKGYISSDMLLEIAKDYAKTNYGKYLYSLI